MGLYANSKKRSSHDVRAGSTAHEKSTHTLKSKKKSLMSNLTFHRFGKHTGFFLNKTLFQIQFLGSKFCDYAEFKTGLIINSIKVTFLSNSNSLKSQKYDKDQNNSDFAKKWPYITSETCSDFKTKQKT